MNEFELIRTYFEVDDHDAVLGIGDDAALIAPARDQLLAVAVDTIVSGQHFPHATAAHAIGHRALAVNLSDLAAMGATPRWFTLALTLPESDGEWLEAFSEGLLSLARQHRVGLIGGDTTRGPLTITVQALGEVGDDALRRDGAKPGDIIYVSRTLGDAAAGLALLDSKDSDDATQFLVDRFLYPTPRVGLGQRLRGRATAAIDISDGLIADLGHICTASNCAAAVDVAALPVSEQLRARVGDETAIKLALQGGDDYELCFTAPAHIDGSQWPDCQAIGRIEEGASVTVYDAGEPVKLERHGYQHFG